MAIDEGAIVAACSQLPLIGNEDGLIPAYNLYLTRHYADYYNTISYETVRRLESAHAEGLGEAERNLTEAGHVCAFNTFGGIMMSPEWDAVVRPMIETREDWVRGIVAVVNSLGWGRWRITGLEPGARLELAIDNSYESTGWLARYARSTRPRCYLAAGGCAGIMNLVYHADITGRPALTPAFFREIFHERPGSFRATEVECRTTGAPACRFVTARRAG